MRKSHIHHIIVAYGDQLGYQHGAKYQILRLLSQFKSVEQNISVVTDHPTLFGRYPVNVLHLDRSKIESWGGEGTDHFGIKLKGYEWASQQARSDYCVLLDTDMFWTRDPSELIRHMQNGRVIIYQDEGTIIGSKDKSIQRFKEGLTGHRLRWAGGTYELEAESRMYRSSIIGMCRKHLDLINDAFDLFKVLSPYVQAHTVEQFALSECLRLNKVEVFEGRKYTNDWSSTGKKDYLTPILAQFFEKEGEHEFNAHLEKWKSIPLRRPAKEFFKQKINKWKTKK